MCIRDRRFPWGLTSDQIRALPHQPWRRHVASRPRFGVVMLIVGCGLGRESASRLAKLALNGSDQRVSPDAFLKERASRE
eukprot:12195518-Alexandrium_andersonii.AAC.1